MCEHCRKQLPYINYWQACKRCGAPYGKTQCTECNTTVLAALGRTKLAYDGCLACVSYNNDSARIVKAWKDHGERRLKDTMALQMAQIIPSSWLVQTPVITPIPARTSACRTRGFDHMSELCTSISSITGLEVIEPFERPKTRDQRKLGRHERQANMGGKFVLKRNARIPPTALIIDDVQTTGATLNAAADALKGAGCKKVYALTYARA